MSEIRGENIERLRNYILRPELSLHNPLPDVLPRQFDPMRLLHVPRCPGSTKLAPRRDQSGQILEFVEVDLEDVGANANNSMSMQREPGLLEEATRGSHSNFPFWPGGFDEQRQQIAALDVDSFQFGDKLLTVPPGFTSGHDFSQSQPVSLPPVVPDPSNVDLLENLEQDLDVQEWMKLTRTEESSSSGLPPSPSQRNVQFPSEEFQDVDDQIMKDDLKPVLNISTTTKTFKSDWAEMVDISQPINDFKEQIPCPAMEFPFELDVFQKQAILKLEQRQYVFVAAHTSAGKTVVAEYAIALSKRDLTRTIYTSPIKALSNQKYRDFRKTFKDVGLITGDLQIEPTASCLIMTSRSRFSVESNSTRLYSVCRNLIQSAIYVNSGYD